ncbi:MAG: DUF2924 domain-containing protein [Acidobacteria bacterium]|nr:DUF2924 domain-containing protein [Acidobacteriota bacterium]
MPENEKMKAADQLFGLGEVDRLALMSPPDLHRMYRDLFGQDVPTSNSYFLRRKIAWHLQARAQGGLPDSARQHALAIARDAELRVRISENASRRHHGAPMDRVATTAVAPLHDSRLPLPGSLLVKEFQGETIVVKVLDEGFEFDGRHFRSLSAVAQAITGTKWNGYLFFQLTKEK